MILLAGSEGPDQTARMRRLIRVFAVRICQKTRFCMALPISLKWTGRQGRMCYVHAFVQPCFRGIAHAHLVPFSVSNRPYQFYSRLSLSWLRLSRITAYLELKIWSLFKHETLTTGNKILWERGEIAISPLFHNIFNISVSSGVKMWLFGYSFFSSILQILYVEVRISRSISESSLDFEITRVDCILNPRHVECVLTGWFFFFFFFSSSRAGLRPSASK